MNSNYRHKTNISVLLFGSGGRQALPLSKGFYELGCIVTAYCESKYDTGYLTKYKHKKILYNPDNIDGIDFYNYGKKIIESGEFELVVPLSDAGATFLSKNKKYLEKYAKIAVNDWDVFCKAIDKKKTMDECQKKGINAPRTIISDNPLEALKTSGLCFPIVIKPRSACGSIGFNIAKNFEQVKEVFSNLSNEPLLIQEYIPNEGNQYECEVFRTKNGDIKACFVSKAPRIYPLDGGSPVLSVPIKNEDICKLGIKLANALNWVGYLDIDLLYDKYEGTFKIIEANPRVGADIKLDFINGVNIAQLIIENEFYDHVTDMNRYVCDYEVACGITDLLWFFKCKKRFSVEPSWFRRTRIKDAIFDLFDVKPFLGFCVFHILHYRENMKKRKRISII